MSDMKPINDTLQIQIEEDGTITCVSGKFGAEVHQSAEEFLSQVHIIMGGQRLKKPLEHQHGVTHHHHHNHEHQRIKQ